jgi:hypothetical protein
MPATIIGLGYRARSGKDTVGEILVRRFGFMRVSFADQLKRTVGQLYRVDPFDPDFKTTALPNGMTGGQALQQIGVALRGVDENIWIHASGLTGYAMMPNARIVVTDVRFPNEAAAVRELGGKLWEIRRPGLPADSHASEIGGREIKWDAVIPNDTTLADLEGRVIACLALSCGIHPAA